MKELLNLPVVTSEHGHQVDELMILLHWLMGVLVVGWTLYFIFVLWRFRGTRRKKADYHGV
jgi:hypothetical protein